MAKIPDMNTILGRIQVGITLNGLNIAEGIKVLVAVAALDPESTEKTEAILAAEAERLTARGGTREYRNLGIPVVADEFKVSDDGKVSRTKVTIPIVADDALGPKTAVAVDMPATAAEEPPKPKKPKLAKEPEPQQGESGSSTPLLTGGSSGGQEPWLVDLAAIPEAITEAKNLRTVVKWFVAAGTTDDARIMREIKRMAEGGGPTFFAGFVASTDPSKKIRDALELIATLGN